MNSTQISPVVDTALRYENQILIRSIQQIDYQSRCLITKTSATHCLPTVSPGKYHMIESELVCTLVDWHVSLKMDGNLSHRTFAGFQFTLTTFHLHFLPSVWK